MADSTLSIDKREIEEEIRRFLSLNRDSGMSGGDIAAALRRGLRKFYWPPPIAPGEPSHAWSFLQLESQLTLRANVAGITTTASGTSLGDTTNSPFVAADMVGAHVKFTTSGNEYRIKSVTDTQNVVLTSALATADASASLAFTIYNGNFPLPDDVGGIVGPLTFDTRTGYPPIQLTNRAIIRRNRQNSYQVNTFRPHLFSIRPRDAGASTSSSTGQRFEVMTWPIPDSTYIVHYNYNKLPDALTSSNRLPLGQPSHAECLLEACLSIAEEWAEAPASRHEGRFFELLGAAIAVDRDATAPERLGYNGDSSTDPERYQGRLLSRTITYNNVAY